MENVTSIAELKDVDVAVKDGKIHQIGQISEGSKRNYKC
jgi:dihydroorotase-like cyclic amidohydrolase